MCCHFKKKIKAWYMKDESCFKEGLDSGRDF